ncbi:putative potassium transporter [Aspergillus foveolatus]|uniref:putative potassium transporter n=1 Tax=Aspergillus foveolatus TaxID=210207 RepID=UPI003CCD9E5D
MTRKCFLSSPVIGGANCTVHKARHCLRLIANGVSTLLPPSLIFRGASNPPRSVSYTNALFMCVSAMKGTGLNSVEASTMTTFQQVIMFVLLMLGHAILISITVRHHKFKGITHALAQRTAQEAPAFSTGDRNENKSYPAADSINVQFTNTGPQGVSHDQPRKAMVDQPSNLKSENERPRVSYQSINKAQLLQLGIWRGTQKYFESKGLISRNSQSHGLTLEERDRLQGVEYKAVSFLSVIVPLYWVLFLCCGILGMGIWLEVNKPQVPQDNGLSPFWTGAFFAVSASVNSGMGILNANMTALQTDAYLLITMGLLILAGNILYPCFLRLIAWSMRRMLPDRPAWKTWRSTLDFILDHFRRLSIQWNDWAGFEVLSIGYKEIEGLPTAYRIMDGLFQALVSAGPAVLIARRHTNVYEERSLCIYAEDETLYGHDKRPPNTVTGFLRRYSTFNIFFEVISAYGYVGISTGYPGRDLSFCGVWHSLSKLILAVVALRGRHRGLPVAIDNAIMLPSESNAQTWAEEENAVLGREHQQVGHLGPGIV